LFKVLIVDDEAMIRKGLKEIIDWGEMGFELAGEAMDGETGLEMIQEIKPDVVLTDIRMPFKDGLEMIEDSNSKGIGSRFIVLSGFSEFNYAVRALKNRVEDYLLKPVDVAELKQILEKLKKEIDQNADRKKQPRNFEMTMDEYAATCDASESHSNNIARILFFLKSNYHRNITLDLISKTFYIEPSYFCKLFKKCTGETYLSYLTNIRVSKACELLKNPEVRVYEVADRIGYENQRHFSQIFKKYTGMTPSEYKENSIYTQKIEH
jgi:two-component system response regulator YesN